MDYYMYCKINLAKEPILKRRYLFHLPGKMFRLQLLAATFIWLMASTQGLADKIVLTDGDIIEGVITKQGRSAVVLEHSDLGRMEIPRSRIKSLIIDTPDVEVVLTDGDTIQGKLVKENESGIVLEHRDLGRMEIPKDRIASSIVEVPEATVVLAGGDTIEGRLVERTNFAIVLEHPNLGRLEIPRERIDSLKIKEPEFKKEEKVGLIDPHLRKLAAKTSRLKEKGWKASVDFSLQSSTGNTQEQSTRFGGHVERELIDMRNELDISYYHKLKEGEVSDNKFTLGMGRDWLYPESLWFYFMSGRFDYDEFESWQKRANGQVGPGYHLIKTDDINLDIGLGLGVRKEWGSQNNNPKFEGLIGADFEWAVTDTQTCTFSPHFFPVVGDLDDYRARVTGEWRFLLDKDMHLNFLIGILYEYQSIVDPEKEHGDLRVYLGLRYNF
jgi:putative salt-induced outer membrane protein YdiY